MIKTRVLVTGGAGNVGGSLARLLARDERYELVVVDNLQTGSADKLPPRADDFTFVRADANRYEDVAPIFAAFRPEVVYHYAATVGVRRTLDNPMQVLADIEGLKNILTLAKGSGCKRTFFSSSSEVYGEPVEMPQREETTPLNSKLPYAVVKNLGEIFFKTYRREFGLPFTIFRFFNTYGPLQSEDFVISKFIGQALAGKPITIYGDGSQTRTFCFVDDSVAFQKQCLDDATFIDETVNVGSDHEITILQLAELVRDILAPGLEIVRLPALAEGDMARRRPDNSRMREALGRDLISLEDGIGRTADFMRQQLQTSA